MGPPPSKAGRPFSLPAMSRIQDTFDILSLGTGYASRSEPRGCTADGRRRAVLSPGGRSVREYAAPLGHPWVDIERCQMKLHEAAELGFKPADPTTIMEAFMRSARPAPSRGSVLSSAP